MSGFSATAPDGVPCAQFQVISERPSGVKRLRRVDEEHLSAKQESADLIYEFIQEYEAGRTEHIIELLERFGWVYRNDECSHVLPFDSLTCSRCGQALDD